MTGAQRAVARAAVRSPQQAWRSWCRFWFDPISPVTVALYRIVYGLLILVFVALLKPEVFTWFAENSPLPPTQAERFWGATPHWSVLFWFPQRPAVAAFFVVFTVFAVFLTIGLWTRFSALVVFLGLISIGHRDPLVLNSGDTLLRVMGFYLILAPAGAALSVDRLRAIARGNAPRQSALAPPWVQRLMQLQVCLVYASTVLLKVKGQAWPAGVALYYTSRLEEFHRFPVPFLAHNMLLVNLGTYWTLATETALAFLVWIPAVRVFVLLNGLLLHAGIEYSMNVPMFGFAMTATYILFCDIEGWWDRMRMRWPVRSFARVELLIDAGCAACRCEAQLALAVDIFQRTAVVDAGPRMDRPPALRLGSGRELRGSAALRWLAWHAPALWAAAPLLSLPGAYEVLRSAPVRAFLGLPRHGAATVAPPGGGAQREERTDAREPVLLDAGGVRDVAT